MEITFHSYKPHQCTKVLVDFERSSAGKEMATAVKKKLKYAVHKWSSYSYNYLPE